MLDWNPALYRRYEDERTRPAQDLLARVPLASATRAVDLGCGPGNSCPAKAMSTQAMSHLAVPKAKVFQ